MPYLKSPILSSRMFDSHLVSPLAGEASAAEGGELRFPAQQLDEEQHLPADDSHIRPSKWR